jgi:hypothetical protein
MRVLPQRTIDALGLQVEVRGQPAKWSGRVARETTPARKRRTTRPFVPCRRRHERSYRHALPSPGVCPPGVPLPSSGSSQGRIPGTFLGRKPAGLSARWGARPDPIAGPRSHPSPLPHSARDTASQRRLAGSRNGRRAVVRPRAIDSHLAPASVENSSRAAAIAFSLITLGLSSGSLRGWVLPGCEVGSFLFRRSGPRRVFVGAVSASQFHAGPSGGQKAAGACRGRIGPPRRGGLEGLLAR